MEVDLWVHFKTVLTSVWPLLSHENKQVCNIVVRWADNQGNHYAGIDQTPIDQTKEWLKTIRDRYTGQIRTDLTNAITFLTRLNLKPLAGYYTTQAGCLRFNFYWYDGACHIDPKEKPPEPPPIPPPEVIPTPEECYTKEKCEAYGYHWYNNKCNHDIGTFLADRSKIEQGFIFEFGTDVVMELITAAKEKLEYWDTRLKDDWDWAWDAAVLEVELKKRYDDTFKTIKGWQLAVADIIGDYTKLGENSIIDLVMKGSSDLSEATKAFIDYMLADMGFMYNEEYKTVSYNTNMMWGNLKKIIDQWEAQEKQLGGVTLEAVNTKISEHDDLNQIAFDDIWLEINKIKEEIGISVEQIETDLKWPVIEKGDTTDWFIIASVGWVKRTLNDYSVALGKDLDTMVDIFTEAINWILQEAVDMSDPWIERLKGKLGDIGGEYDLAADELFQETLELVVKTSSTVTEMPDWWVSALAGKLEGYLTVGIGEKGEKGDPGVPGARGIQGIPGVKGDPGEPGEGVGLAIDDIDRQLKDRLAEGGAIITTNVTGVIDYNIGKIGEIFTRYDLEVKPITDFLTTDMQSSLTDIVEAFGTPEALIAYLLDVPEGEEEGMLALMQILIAQTMERGIVYETV